MEAVKIYNKKIQDYLYCIVINDNTLISNRNGIEKYFKVTILPDQIPAA